MKDKWSNYALKDGKIQSSYKREYCNRKKVRKTGETSNSDSNVQSRKVEEEVVIEPLVYRDPTHYKAGINPIILNDAWVINLRGMDEIGREENIVETHQQGQQGIQVPAEGRPGIEEEDTSKTERKKVMKKEKDTAKHKKHEASESKAYEKKEDKKEKVAKANKKN